MQGDQVLARVQSLLKKLGSVRGSDRNYQSGRVRRFAQLKSTTALLAVRLLIGTRVGRIEVFNDA